MLVSTQQMFFYGLVIFKNIIDWFIIYLIGKIGHDIALCGFDKIEVKNYLESNFYVF